MIGSSFEFRNLHICTNTIKPISFILMILLEVHSVDRKSTRRKPYATVSGLVFVFCFFFFKFSCTYINLDAIYLKFSFLIFILISTQIFTFYQVKEISLKRRYFHFYFIQKVEIKVEIKSENFRLIERQFQDTAISKKN